MNQFKVWKGLYVWFYYYSSWFFHQIGSIDLQEDTENALVLSSNEKIETKHFLDILCKTMPKSSTLTLLSLVFQAILLVMFKNGLIQYIIVYYLYNSDRIMILCILKWEESLVTTDWANYIKLSRQKLWTSCKFLTIHYICNSLESTDSAVNKINI